MSDADRPGLKEFLHQNFFAPWCGMTPGAWCKTLSDGGMIAPRYWPRAGFVSFCALGNGPPASYDRWRFDGAVAAAGAHPVPLFILGHWR
ncbi:MAG: hypothetical protein ACRDD1_17980, partial [Planctomycetia bacterium]